MKAKHQEKVGEVQKQGETIRKLQEALTKSHIELDASRKKTDEEVGGDGSFFSYPHNETSIFL